MTRGDPRRRASRRRHEDQGHPRAEMTAPQEPAGLPSGMEEVPISGEPPSQLETAAEEGPEKETTQEEPAEEVVETLRDQILRLQAEFDNYRKRQAREFHRLCAQGRRDLIAELLAVLDNIDRGREHSAGGAPAEEVLPGMFQTADQLQAILAKEGLEQIPVAPMEPFDPNLHEAVLAEDREDLERDSVLEVFRKGYMFEQDLLRPALVKVGRAGKPAGEEE